MKILKKTIIFTIATAVLLLLNATNAKAISGSDVTWSNGEDKIQYFITKFNMTGTTLEIRGYAYAIMYQNYNRHNHNYYIILKGRGTGAESRRYLLPNKNQSINMKIGGINNYCGDTEINNPYCQRIMDWVGFEGSIDISQAIDDMGSSKDSDYDIYLQIEELASGRPRTLYTQIRTFPQLIGGEQSTEYKNITFNVNKNAYSDSWHNDTVGMIAKKSAAGAIWRTGDFGWGTPVAGRDNMYVCSQSVCGNANFPFYDYGQAADGIYWLAGYAQPWRAVDWLFGGNYTMYPGGGNIVWATTARVSLQGTFAYLTKYKTEYAGINNITTYTAKAGDKTKVEATYTNTKSNSPVYYKLCVESDCTEGTSTATGLQTITKEINATSSNRKVTFYINETYTNIPKDDETTLYASSNKSVAFTSETGSYTPDTPIKVVKNYNQNPIKYKETITYTNPQNYLLTNGDYKGAELNRQTKLTYSSGSAENGTIYNSTQSVKNTISSPNSTSPATYVSNKSAELATEDIIYIPFTDLKNKTIKTTYSGVGVNNVTIVLQANYNFDNFTTIGKIDSHTTEKTENSNIKFDVNNSNLRNVKWELYYGEKLIKEGQDEWNGLKTFNLDDFIVSENKNVTIKLTESNGVITKLTGPTYIAEETSITLENNKSYTPETPVRAITTVSGTTDYFETITLGDLNSSININAGEGFENKLKISYSTTSDDTVLNNNEIKITATFPEQDSDLDYPETSDGVIVPLESTSSSNTENIFELPEVMVEKSKGFLYRKDDSRINGLEVLNGGRKWYTKMTAETSNYDFVNTLTHVGVNAINIKYYNNYNITGSLLGNIDSTFKVIRVQNPSNPNYTWHKTYTLSELLTEFSQNKD